jgi:MFS superfamily sulfate permease-like transporter
MLSTLEVLSLVLLSFAMIPAVAHALELPGKMRLPKDTYIAVQPIYYPGFTVIGGAAEVLAPLLTLVLLFLTPRETAGFWLIVSAVIALVLMHAVFWVFTQPVNRYWLREQHLGTAGRKFFRVSRSKATSEQDWETARDRWEYSHVVRAILATAAFVLLASAVAQHA